nr:unnamed protein product [Digitaria exilis]
MAGAGDADAAAGVDAEIVVVGGGIAGLATALALCRAGVARHSGGGGVLVLERHAELRATGAAMTIFPNGWFALRALGVAHKLTSRYDSYEISKVTNLETGATQVLIGCDGVHSVVARWLGLSEPLSSGRSCVRGLSTFPDGHSLKRELRQFLSPGLRAGMVPVSDTHVYWFLINDPIAAAEEDAAGDPVKTLREVTGNLAGHMPSEFLDVVRRSDHKNLSWAPLLYRSPVAIVTGTAAARGGAVTVAGDAFHPMTPDMAQGGCSAMEDAVVLARALARARASPAEGVAAYVAERRWRAAWMVAGAYLSGWVQQGGGSGANARGVRRWLVKVFRDWVFYPFVFPRLADMMWFDCGDLETTCADDGKSHTE